MTCRECGVEVKTWGCVLLCDRCLDARLYNELKQDEYVLLRRMPSGDITLAQGPGGGRWTNLTALKMDPERETMEAVRDFLAA